eukprot:scaffold6727_cov106-Isochrysis_galbana.AAC.4
MKGRASAPMGSGDVPAAVGTRGQRRRRWAVWEYELYGGARLAPHRLYVFARFLTPPKGV